MRQAAQPGESLERKPNHDTIARRHGTTNLSLEQAFFSDRKGDPANIQYGSLDQYKVSRYRNAGFGRLIGLDRRFRVLSTSGSAREVDDTSQDSTRKHGHNSLLEAVATEDTGGEVLVPMHHAENVFIGQLDYINISSDENHADDHPSSITDVNQQDHLDEISLPYLSSAAGGNPKSGNHHSSKSTIDDSFEQYRNNPVIRRNNDLLKAVEIHPQDLSSWLDLIEHQADFLKFQSHENPQQTAVCGPHAVSEMRMSLYEKALSKMKSSSDKVTLLKGRMEEGLQLWDTNRQLLEWKQILHQTMFSSIWLDYLHFVEHSAIAFKFDTCFEAYSQAFAAASKLETPDQYLVNLTLAFTTFLYQAGYTERSIALWQAIVEINFFRPVSDQSNHSRTSFQEFWESEVARMGEANGRGWGKSDHTPKTPVTDELPARLDVEDLWSSWSAAETTASTVQVMPARTMDEVTESDPFRIILFSDINNFIYQLQGTSNQILVIQALLSFCALPALQVSNNERFPWSIDTSSSSVSSINPTSTPKYMVTDASTLAAPLDSQFSCFSKYSVLPSLLLDFLVNILSELVMLSVEFDNVAEYLIALKAINEPTAAKKFTRSLIKARSDRPRLYNMYGLIQVRAGKVEEAEKIWVTAISMANSFDHSLRNQIILLWESWIWELLAQQKFTRAVVLLVDVLPKQHQSLEALTAVDPYRKFTEDDVLQARQHLSTSITSSIRESNSDCTIAYINLLAILNYLLNNRNIDEALHTYRSTFTSPNVSSDQFPAERIHQSQARLIDLHIRSSPTGYKPMQIAKVLQQSHDQFPNNGLFYNLYETYARQAGRINPLRSLGGDITLNSFSTGTPNPRVQATHQHQHQRAVLKIATVLARPLYEGSTPHSIRSTFKAATSDFPHIPSLWTTWLHWELGLVSSETSVQASVSMPVSKRVKEIYLSSLRACPGVKDLYMIGFTHPVMRRALGDQGLEDVYRSMLDRGLRLRIDIEDLVDRRTQQHG